ncbi:MAG: hypothetical protein KGI78_01755 [Patescibacteria group bacterium]|nr:hypothetical protein [Patescibacteria group bacterium]MDE2057560.1 hypothetical protein [Patescibacteria group bacterium]
MFVVRRDPHNPLLAPERDRPWEARACFNPSAVVTPEGTRLFYRALGNGDIMQTPSPQLSSIGTAFAEDGTHFHSRRQVIAPQESWDKFGCEDPRVTFFEGRWYCFYTALGGYPFGPDNIKVGCAVGDDPEHFTERHLVTPFNAKAAALFPERVGGEVVLLLTAHTDYTNEHPRPTIALARAKEVADFWQEDYWRAWHDRLAEHALPELRRADGDHIEVGAAPVLTDLGWLLVYSYIEDYYDEAKRTFTIEAALLAADDPQRLLSRTESFLVPEETYEEYGIVPRIAFPSGATRGADGALDIWYGAADTVCAKASIRLADLLRALDPAAPAPPFARAEENPILAPRGAGFEARDVFNAAALDLEGAIYILYRAMSADNTSTIGLAISRDGVHIDERLPEPVYAPRAEFEMKKGPPAGNSGCEDPRAVVMGDTLYLSYTAYDGARAPKGAITSISIADFLARRFERWSAPVLTTPEEVDDKDTALLPAQVDGNFVVYHRVGGQICADLVPDLSFEKRVSRCIEIFGPRHGMWDSEKVGIAGPPIKVPQGWLMIYHGVSRHATYRLGAALFAEDGLTLLARTADPIFEPREPYEQEGEVKDVVFSCGQVVRDDTIYLYYGAADKVLGVATGSLSALLAALT